ncbi:MULTISPECIES: metallophosphoesterase [Chelativorans]|jgi:hypothetical protein|uniref:Calcineurin-like phosphoesterase domain-containing protein n=1 Tax=Chelativorans sp. (strain BNC1) TaxID=266779 RepID=Q11LS3_CHESB|nr:MULTISPECIES: metallophosphoesterase [Chelativorans]
MKIPSLDDETIQKIIQTYRETGNFRETGRIHGVAESSVRKYVKKAREEVQYTPDLGDLGTGKPRIRVRAYNPNMTRELQARRVICIGDMHRKPGQPIEIMRFIGRYVAETRPDNVIQIGDFLDMESCEFHSAPGSAAQMQRPCVLDEIDHGDESLSEYHKEVGVGEIPHHVTLGNHEFRANRLEELAPNLTGTVTIQIDQLFSRYRWAITPYKHWMFLEGVGFTHVPLSIMGKPVGGRYPENTIGNQSTHSVVFGHTHRYNHVTVPKIGINNSITVTNVGCAMPYGYIPNYADGCTTGYSYGIADLRLRGGRVESASFISMLDLQERFS